MLIGQVSYILRGGRIQVPYYRGIRRVLASEKGLFATVLLAVDPRTSTSQFVAALLVSAERIGRVNRARIMFPEHIEHAGTRAKTSLKCDTSNLYDCSVILTDNVFTISV